MDIYRAEQAKKLFSYGTVSSKEAAFLLGFKEQSAFRHAFKGWTGQTISEYRSAAVVSLTTVPSVVDGRKKEASKSFFRRRTGTGHISI